MGAISSIAEHTWRMSLMAVLMEPYLEQEVDMAKLLKMVIMHELIEAEAGDASVLDMIRDPSLILVKQPREIQVIENLRYTLSEPLGFEIYALWFGFEEKSTYVAKVTNAFDKLEVQLQHNEADITTWEPVVYDLFYLMDRHVGFDAKLRVLKDLIEDQADQKIKACGTPSILSEVLF